MKNLKILGIDPGFGRTGYGVIEVEGHNNYKTLTFGVFETEKHLPHHERLKMIYEKMTELLDEFKPQRLAIEELFFHKNVTTALGVGEARGVIMLAAAQRGLPITECSPLNVKLTITGNGRAEKRQVQKMIQILLRLDQMPKPDDAADALAVALTAARSVWQESLL